MAKKEVNTDLWVHELLKEAGIRENFDAQGSNDRWLKRKIDKKNLSVSKN